MDIPQLLVTGPEDPELLPQESNNNNHHGQGQTGQVQPIQTTGTVSYAVPPSPLIHGPLMSPASPGLVASFPPLSPALTEISSSTGIPSGVVTDDIRRRMMASFDPSKAPMALTSNAARRGGSKAPTMGAPPPRRPPASPSGSKRALGGDELSQLISDEDLLRQYDFQHNPANLTKEQVAMLFAASRSKLDPAARRAMIAAMGDSLSPGADTGVDAERRKNANYASRLSRLRKKVREVIIRDQYMKYQREAEALRSELETLRANDQLWQAKIRRLEAENASLKANVGTSPLQPNTSTRTNPTSVEAHPPSPSAVLAPLSPAPPPPSVKVEAAPSTLSVPSQSGSAMSGSSLLPVPGSGQTMPQGGYLSSPSIPMRISANDPQASAVLRVSPTPSSSSNYNTSIITDPYGSVDAIPSAMLGLINNNNNSGSNTGGAHNSFAQFNTGAPDWSLTLNSDAGGANLAANNGRPQQAPHSTHSSLSSTSRHLTHPMPVVPGRPSEASYTTTHSGAIIRPPRSPYSPSQRRKAFPKADGTDSAAHADSPNPLAPLKAHNVHEPYAKVLIAYLKRTETGTPALIQTQHYNAETRFALIDWMATIADRHLRRSAQTVATAIRYMDQAMNAITVSARRQLQLIAAVALLLAIKYEDGLPLPIADLRTYSGDKYSVQDFLQMEVVLFNCLSASTPGLRAVTHYTYLPYFAQALDADTRLDQLEVEMVKRFAGVFADLALRDQSILSHLPSFLAAACIAAGRLIKKHSMWSSQLAAITGLEETQELQELVKRLHNQYQQLLQTDETTRGAFIGLGSEAPTPAQGTELPSSLPSGSSATTTSTDVTMAEASAALADSQQAEPSAGDKRPNTGGLEPPRKIRRRTDDTSALSDDGHSQEPPTQRTIASAPSAFLEQADKLAEVEVVGSGRFGVVWKVEDKTTGQIYALKKHRLDTALASDPEDDKKARKSGIHWMIVRQAGLVKVFDHTNIVRLHYSLLHGSEYWMVFEYMKATLREELNGYAESRTRMDPTVAKSYLSQLLSGLDHCHSHGIMHRDLKPANILVDDRGVSRTLKITDFGLSRYFSPEVGSMTPTVVTLWYRAPELLLGSRYYSSSIDVWSVGCIFAELLTGDPLFPGSSELDQLAIVFALIGRPALSGAPETAARWDEYFAKRPYIPGDAADLLKSMLRRDPAARPTAAEALKHPYFTSDADSFLSG